MITQTIFHHTQRHRITPCDMTCSEFISKIVHDLADDIDGSNINQVRDFVSRLYYYSHSNGYTINPPPPNEFKNVASFKLN